MYLIVGLGNPGREYERTRHNIGFAVVDRISKDLNIPVEKEKCGALIGPGEIKGTKIMLVKPQTFMNISGTAVSSLVHWFKIDIKKIILIYDDMDIGVGELKLKPKGSSAGHKGVESVIASLKTSEIMRVRIGIGSAAGEAAGAEHVLAKIPKKEQEALDSAVLKAADAVRVIIENGMSEAMNRFNSPA